MKKDFESLYQQIQTENKDKLQEAWIEAKNESKKANMLFLIIAIIVDVFFIFKFSNIINFELSNIIFIIPVLIIHLFVFLIIKAIFSKKQREYNTQFKELVIEGMLSNFYTDLDYIPKKQMPESIYNEGKYPEYFNRYYSDDYLEATIDNKYEIKMAEVHTVKETTRTDSDGHTHTTRTTKFHGLFVKININKSIQNELTIKPNGSIWKKNRLEMDSQEFEKLFDVSSNNKIIGMQLLTHDVMQLLVDFQNIIKTKFDVCIYDNIMYLRLSTGSIFEMKSLKKGALDKMMLQRYYDILTFINNLSKEIIKVIEEAQI